MADAALEMVLRRDRAGGRSLTPERTISSPSSLGADTNRIPARFR